MLSPLMPLVVLAVPAMAQPSPRVAIEAAMADSAAGWNTGDLDRFMAVYADDATYVAGGNVLRGKPAIAARYRSSFTATGNSRGRLSFQPLALRPLSAAHCLYVARWTLTPAAGATAAPQTGMTSLVFERRRDRWKIVADHSS